MSFSFSTIGYFPSAELLGVDPCFFNDVKSCPLDEAVVLLYDRVRFSNSERPPLLEVECCLLSAIRSESDGETRSVPDETDMELFALTNWAMNGSFKSRTLIGFGKFIGAKASSSV